MSSGLGNISQGTSPAKINLTHVQKGYNAIVSGSPCDSNLRITRILALHSDFLPQTFVTSDHLQIGKPVCVSHFDYHQHHSFYVFGDIVTCARHDPNPCMSRA